MRREQGLKAFTVLSCDNVRENGHVAKAAVLGSAKARDAALAAWIADNVTFPAPWLTALFRQRPKRRYNWLPTSWAFMILRYRLRTLPPVGHRR